MEATWVTELRNYWHIIGKETEALLRRDCIKDYMLFNDGFKNDLLETANKRIADTYERFLEDTNDIRQIALRNGFNTNANEQRNHNESILSENVITSTAESGYTFAHQPNQHADFNDVHDTNQRSSSSNESRIVWSGKVNCANSNANGVSPGDSTSQEESLSTQEPNIVRSSGQQPQGITHDELNVSLSQHSINPAPDTVCEESCISNHEQTLSDLHRIIHEGESNQNSPNQNAESHDGIEQLEDVLEDCFDNADIESALNLVADSTIMFSDADLHKPQEMKSEQGFVGESAVTVTVTGDNRNDDLLIVSTDLHLQTIDLTLDSVVAPADKPSVIIINGRNSNNANNSNTPAKKRRNVGFVGPETPGKKPKVDAESNTKQQINSPMSNHKMSYKCIVCAKEFNRYSKLEAHMKAHENDIMFQCSICHQSFSRSQENTWKSHENQCKKLRRYECHICKLMFRTGKETLLIHIRSKHTGEKPFHCSECQKCFVSQGMVAYHMKKDHKKGRQATVHVKTVTN